MSDRPIHRHRFRWLLTTCTSLAVVALIYIVALPRIAPYGAAWSQVRLMSTIAVVLLGVTTVLNVLTYPPPWIAAVPGLRFRRAFELTMATTALATVAPLGGAVAAGVGWRMLREWGFSRRAATVGTLVTGVATQILGVVFSAMAVGLLTLSGERSSLYSRLLPWALGVLLAVITPIVLVLASSRTARWMGVVWQRLVGPLWRVTGRGALPGDGDGVVRFRSDSLTVLRHRWLSLAWTNVANLATSWLVLVTTLWGVGLFEEISLIEAFAAWALARLLVAIPLTPGGLGIVELAMTSALSGFGGDESAVVAAVLVFRALTLLPPLLLGAASGFTWRRGARALTHLAAESAGANPGLPSAPKLPSRA